jgi:hypothetical protein
MPRTNRTTERRLAVPILFITALLVACDRDREPTAPTIGGIQADLIPQDLTYLTALFFANELLIPDGSITQDEPPFSGHTIHVVDRDNKNSWKIDGSTEVITFDDELTCDPLRAPPLPPGALHLVSATGDEVTRLRSTRYHRTYLRDLSRLDYHACDEQNSGQWPYIVLDIDWNGDNQIDDRIIFEPSRQSLPTGPCLPNQGPAELNQWQFWDALNGDPGQPETFMACWYQSCAVADPPCGPLVTQPLSAYIAAHQDAAIVNLDGNHGGVQITHGVISLGYNGWVDAFTIGKDINGNSGQTLNSTITYDFEKP